MANPYNAYQSTVNSGDVTIKDYAHAARIFVDDNFRLLPKQKFLFHVVFGINQSAVKDLTTVQKNRNEISLLVKSASLPNYTIKTETLNQYNRKKIIQTTHEYQPITIKFRDDSANIVNKLWWNYYSYYFADPITADAPGAYARNAMKKKNNNSYGLDNKSTKPFFNHITIYQLTRHEYNFYKLVNPVISGWNHEGMDYSNIGHNENTMTVGYEAVSYGSGIIGDDTSPTDFGSAHYDTTPSPLSVPQTLIRSYSSNTATDATTASNAKAEAVNNSITSINTYQNTQQKPSSGSPGITTNVIGTSLQGVSGVQGTAFPIPQSKSSITVATKVKL